MSTVAMFLKHRRTSLLVGNAVTTVHCPWLGWAVLSLLIMTAKHERDPGGIMVGVPLAPTKAEAI